MTMTRRFLLLILLVSFTHASPLGNINNNKTGPAFTTPSSTTLKHLTTTIKATDIYDEYDEKYYKDYYDGDYLGEIAEKDAKRDSKISSFKSTTTAAGVSAVSIVSTVPTVSIVKTLTTVKSATTVEPVTLTSKKMVKSSVTVPQTKSDQSSEYDFSEYLDYNDYYDQDADKVLKKSKLKASTTVKSRTTTTTVKAVLSEKKVTTGEDDEYVDYAYDEGEELDQISTKASKVGGLKLKHEAQGDKKSTLIFDFKSTTNSPELKSTKKKTSEYDEYYEDEYYQDKDKESFDYYADDYKYDYESDTKQANTTAKTTSVKSVSQGIMTTLKPKLNMIKTTTDKYQDDYDPKNYDDYDNMTYYDDSENYESIFEEESTTKNKGLVNLTTTTASVTYPRPIDIQDKTIMPSIITTLITKTTIEQSRTKPLTTTTTVMTTTFTTTKPETTTTNRVKIIKTTKSSTTTKTTLDSIVDETFYYKENEYNIPSNLDQNTNITSFRGDLKLQELIKSPALLAGIFGGLLLGLVTAIFLLVFIIYRIRQRKYDQTLQYDLDSKIAKEKRRNERHVKKLRKSNSHHRHVENNQTTTNLLIDDVGAQSSQLSTPSNNNSNTGLLISGQATAVVNSRLLKYTNVGSARMMNNDGSQLPSPANCNDGSLNYAYIKAPTKEFYA